MISAFNVIATSTETPDPSDLAGSIGMASFLSIPTIPLGILGIVLLIAGFLVRRPVADS